MVAHFKFLNSRPVSAQGLPFVLPFMWVLMPKERMLLFFLAICLSTIVDRGTAGRHFIRLWDSGARSPSFGPKESMYYYYGMYLGLNGVPTFLLSGPCVYYMDTWTLLESYFGIRPPQTVEGSWLQMVLNLGLCRQKEPQATPHAVLRQAN